jgi:hypothetical protein
MPFYAYFRPMPSPKSLINVHLLILMHWMTGFAALTFLLIFSNDIIAQRPQYKIDVALDTAAHHISGTIGIAYTNHSPEPLSKLGVHLYPNAYFNNHTALAKQMARNGSVAMASAPGNARGYIAGLKFVSGKDSLNLEYDPLHSDIGWIMLTKPLLPKETIELRSSFVVQVPKSFSRLGRTGDAYQVTQWYPHIAVLNSTGWHTMPYLDYGEYFNDFADYDVTIRAPEGYTIAATGTARATVSDDKRNVWKFKADNVIDFAWFASPYFKHEQAVVTSKSKEVSINIYSDTTADHNWKDVMTYAKRAIDHYTDWLGEYPYEQISVVSTPSSAAGFMEYPMVAQISYTGDAGFLETAIVHEIGHTWVYGALANDERTHPWMDEGLNTFIEERYTEKYLPDYAAIAISPDVYHRKGMSQDDAWQHYTCFSNRMQPPATDPTYQSVNQYIHSAYILPAQGLDLLMARHGEDMVRDMTRMYYEDHKYKHVSPDDMRSSFESICDCNLGWLFVDWMEQSHNIDYRIARWNIDKQELVLENHGHDGIPVQVTTYSAGERVESIWVDGFSGQKNVTLLQRADEVRLYEDVPAINRQWWRRVDPKPLLPFFTIFPKTSSYYQSAINVTPFAATNQSDGPMLGAVLTAGLIPQSKFKWILAPFYGLESKSIRGYGEARYIGDFKRGAFDKFLLTFGTDYFGYEVDTHYHFRNQYLRLSPEAGLRFARKNPHSLITQWLKYRYVDVQQFYGVGINFEEGTFARDTRQYGVQELSYSIQSDYGLRPMRSELNVQQGKGFVRVNLNYKQHFVGRDKQRGLWVHGFAGALPHYDNPDATVRFAIHGYASSKIFSNDYMFDHWLGGRNANDGLYARQIFPRDANLKTLVTNGIGSEWMIGGGVSFALPFKWIHVYMDGAYYPNDVQQETILSYSGGFALVMIKDVFEIYLPLLESKDIRESLSYVVRDQWFERVAFQFNFKFANPLDLVDRINLRY